MIFNKQVVNFKRSKSTDIQEIIIFSSQSPSFPQKKLTSLKEGHLSQEYFEIGSGSQCF